MCVSRKCTLERRAFILSASTVSTCRFELGASFVSTTFESEADFSSADFQGPALFQRAEFKAHVPTFFGATLHEYTEWHGAKWPAVPEGTDQALNHIHGYQRLAKMMNELEMFDDQLRFVRLEMRARRRVEKWFPAGLMNHAYELICDYGFGLGRILAIWAGHVAVGAALLFVPKLIETLKNGGGAHFQRAEFKAHVVRPSSERRFTNTLNGMAPNGPRYLKGLTKP